MMKYAASLSITLLLAFAATAQVNLQLGLIANYPLNNSILDASSNHLDLTEYGFPSGEMDRFGRSNYAYNLRSSNPDYFTVSSTLLSPSEVTVAAWVNLVDASRDQKIAGKAVVGGGYLLGVDSNKIDPEFWDSYNNHFRHKAGFVTSNAWDHLVVSFKANDYMKSYINGVLIDSIPTSVFGLGITSWPFTIGGAPWQPTALNVDGSIDDVYVYSRALNAAEVFALYTQITSTIDGHSTIGMDRLYPVPLSADFLNVEFKQHISGNVKVNIIDVLGKDVYSADVMNLKRIQLDLSDLENGAYTLSLMNGGNIESHVFTIER